MKRFDDLSETEVLALAISNEEEDSRVYRGFRPLPAREISHNRCDVRRHGRRRERAPTAADRHLHGALRRSHPAHPPAGRARQPGTQAALAGQRRAASRRSGNMRPRWSAMPSGSTALQPAARAMLRCASCSATLPTPRPARAPRGRHPGAAAVGRQAWRGGSMRPAGASCSRSFSPAWSASWTVRCRRWRPFSPRRSPPTIPGTRFWSAWRPRSGPASRWASPRRWLTTARFQDAAPPICAASSAD